MKSLVHLRVCLGQVLTRSDTALHLCAKKFQQDLFLHKVNKNLNSLFTARCCSHLAPFEKNFYIPSEATCSLSDEEVSRFRKLHNMAIKGSDAPAPIMKFTDYNFSPHLSAIFEQKGFIAPTPIQAQGWPIALSGRDFIGIGQTGSGKTLGFILPALIHIQNQPPVCRREGPVALVLAPTRELAQQTAAVATETMTNVCVSCVFGGASRIAQERQLRNCPSMVIATPGRLLDFLESGVTNLKRCTFLVLDEADRMLDMGFEPQIREVIDQMRPDRQTLMWSATWPHEVQYLAKDFLNNFIKLTIGSEELKANPNIHQEFEVCEDFNEKRNRFVAMMKKRSNEQGKVLVFSETKIGVDKVTYLLQRNRVRACAIHGNHKQQKRDTTIAGFRRGSFNVLVATDVAARGLDIDDISLVVNYDFPNCIENYVHRIGRTARGERSGKSLSYLTQKDASLVKDLIKVLRESGHSIPENLGTLRPTPNLKRKITHCRFTF